MFSTAQRFVGPYLGLMRASVAHWTATGRDWRDRAALRRGFAAHDAHVRGVVPAPRRLEFRAGDGWAPLCAFLGRPIPDGPYPHANEGMWSANMHYVLLVVRWLALLGTAARTVAPVALGVVIGMVAVWMS